MGYTVVAYAAFYSNNTEEQMSDKRKLQDMLSNCMKTGYAFLMFSMMQSSRGLYAQADSRIAGVRDKHIQYEGRIGFDDLATAKIYWAGSSVRIRFKGTAVKATMKDEGGGNYYNIVIDEDSIQILKPGTIKTTYTLADHLSPGEHTIELFKRTDGKAGMTRFYGFELPANSILLDLPQKKRVIEFYGNSITVGSGINEGKFPGGDENNYLSYAAITARHFNARYTCIARSGIGLMVSWFRLIMPEMYTRLNPDDSASKWDFKKNIPDVVVINLLQNDNSLVELPDHPQFKNRFGKKPPGEDYITSSYKRFVRNIRSFYPHAEIICTLGNMDAVRPGSPWPGYIEKAVASLGDKKIVSYFFPYKGTPDHPDVKEQHEMADGLIRFIEERIKW